jgi:hypothetical protein
MPFNSPRRMAGSPRQIQTNPPPVKPRAHAMCNCGTCVRVKNERWRRWWYSQGRTRLNDPGKRMKAADSKARLSEPTDAELDRRATKWLEAIRA